MENTEQLSSIKDSILSFQVWDQQEVGIMNTEPFGGGYSMSYGTQKKYLPLLFAGVQPTYKLEQQEQQQLQQPAMGLEDKFEDIEQAVKPEYIDDVDKMISDELDLESEEDDPYSGNHTIEELFTILDSINGMFELERTRPYTGSPKADDAIDDRIEAFTDNLDEWARQIEVKMLGMIPNAGYNEEMFQSFRRVKTNDGVLNFVLVNYTRILDDLLNSPDNVSKKHYLGELVTCVSRFRERDRDFQESVIVEPSNDTGTSVFEQP